MRFSFFWVFFFNEIIPCQCIRLYHVNIIKSINQSTTAATTSSPLTGLTSTTVPPTSVPAGGSTTAPTLTSTAGITSTAGTTPTLLAFMTASTGRTGPALIIVISLPA